MVYAGAHFVINYFLFEIFRIKYQFKKYIPYIAALGGLVPDFDFSLVLLLENPIYHRALTHEIFIPIIITILGFLFAKKYMPEILAFSVGYLLHLALDQTSKLGIKLTYFLIFDGILITIYVLYKIIQNTDSGVKHKLL